MNAKNFAKGVGVGMALGTAVSMSVAAANKKPGSRQHKMSKTLRTMGDIVENIGNTFSM